MCVYMHVFIMAYIVQLMQILTIKLLKIILIGGLPNSPETQTVSVSQLI